MRDAYPLDQRRTIVVSFQNGIGDADVLRAALPQNAVLEGMVPFNVVGRGLGVFHQGSAGELEIRHALAMQPFIDKLRMAGLPLIHRADMLPVCSGRSCCPISTM